MIVYCPKCGSANIWPQDDPFTLDVEVHQVLKGQHEKCMMCKHFWTDKWWEVWKDGEVTIHEADEHGNAIHHDDED